MYMGRGGRGREAGSFTGTKTMGAGY